MNIKILSPWAGLAVSITLTIIFIIASAVFVASIILLAFQNSLEITQVSAASIFVSLGTAGLFFFKRIFVR